MNSIGQLLNLTGNFTMLRYIENLTATDLERTVGFEAGRLSSGFSIVALTDDQLLTPSDFELKASTRWSAGAIGSTSSSPGNEIETLLSGRGQDVAALKAKVCKLFSQRGGFTPAKVLPNLRHTPGMLYPDAEALGPGISSGVPQFNLTVVHKFMVVGIG